MAFGIILRVTHTGLSGSSILVDDILDGSERYPNLYSRGGPNYVPVNGSVDLAYGGLVAASYERGQIRKFIEIGHLSATFVFGPDFAAALPGGPPNPHASTHVDGGSDEINADLLDISFVPTNYTRDASIPEANDIQDLAAHLKGIDSALASGTGSIGSRSWKELLVSTVQLDSANDALSQATVFFLDGNAVTTDNFTITDGTTTETFTILATPLGAFDVQLGASADLTMTNLVTSINTDSILWSASKVSSLESINDGSGTSTAGDVIVIYRTNQSSTSFTDRIYGTFATPANAVYVNYFGLTDYESSTNAQLPNADPGQKEFGIGYATADLLSGQTHLIRSGDTIHTWDSDAGQWNLTGSGANYGLIGDIQSVGSSLSAGILNRVARADHVHTHGDRGVDGTVSQHDADQIDVEGTYAQIGSPTQVETALSNINTALTGAKAGRLISFGQDQKIPNSGTLFLKTAGDVVSSSVGVRMLRAGELRGASVQVDTADATRSYKVSIYLNGTEQETLALAATNTGAHTTSLSANYSAGDLLSVALVLTAGAGKSDFTESVVLVGIVDNYA